MSKGICSEKKFGVCEEMNQTNKVVLCTIKM